MLIIAKYGQQLLLWIIDILYEKILLDLFDAEMTLLFFCFCVYLFFSCEMNSHRRE